MSSIHLISYVYINFSKHTTLGFAPFHVSTIFKSQKPCPTPSWEQTVILQTTNVGGLSLMFSFAWHLDISEFRNIRFLTITLIEWFLCKYLHPNSQFCFPTGCIQRARLTHVCQDWSLGCALSLALKLVLSLQVTHSTDYRTLWPRKSNTNSIHCYLRLKSDQFHYQNL